MAEFLLAAALLGFAAVSVAEHPAPAAATAGAAAGLLFIAAARRVAGAFRSVSAVDVRFSPRGGCTQVIVAELGKARREILVQAYSFTCPDIAKALVTAARRGVDVKVLLDRSNEAESYSELGDITGHGIEVLIDSHHAIAHNKIMILDRKTVLTGSFNFTRQAEHENAENLVVLTGHPELAARYRENFFAHRSHSQPPGSRPAATHAARHRGLQTAAT